MTVCASPLILGVEPCTECSWTARNLKAKIPFSGSFQLSSTPKQGFTNLFPPHERVWTSNLAGGLRLWCIHELGCPVSTDRCCTAVLPWPLAYSPVPAAEESASLGEEGRVLLQPACHTHLSLAWDHLCSYFKANLMNCTEFFSYEVWLPQ